MLLAHVCAHDLEQADGKCRLLLEVALQHGELDRVDLRGALRHGVEDVDRLLLVKRQLADDAAARGEAQREHAPRHRVLRDEDLARAHDVEVARHIPFVEEIFAVVQHDDLARYLIEMAHERLHLVLLLRLPFFHRSIPLFYLR